MAEKGKFKTQHSKRNAQPQTRETRAQYLELTEGNEERVGQKSEVKKVGGHRPAGWRLWLNCKASLVAI